MHALVKNISVPHDEKWPLSVAVFLLAHAFFDVRTDEEVESYVLGQCQAPLSERTRRLCATRLTSVLGELASHPPFGGVSGEVRSHALDGTMASGDFRIFMVAKVALALLEAPNSTAALHAALSAENLTVLQSLWKVAQKVSRSSWCVSERFACC
jgi:hypothetical protein